MILFTPKVGPFPSDLLTVADSRQKTGRHVNMPAAPACLDSDYLSCDAVTELLNELDGFSVKPQFNICFSGPINPDTLKGGIAVAPANGNAPAIGINNVLYDSTTHCVLAKPDHVLDQSTRYLLFVSNRVRGPDGTAVVADDAFKSCVLGDGTPYCAALSRALTSGPREARAAPIVGASLFTTMSATDWLQKARQFLYTSSVKPTVLPAGPKSIFNIADLQVFEWLPQTNIAVPDPFEPIPIPTETLEGVEKVAFGLYLSPNFLEASGTIAVTPTNRPIQAPVPVDDPSGYIPISYHVFLPHAGPGAKIPVVIYVHGSGDSQFGAPTAIASTLAKAGFATLAMEVVGHGFGPKSVVRLMDSTGTYKVEAPGRSVPLNPDGSIVPGDGCQTPGPIAVRDCLRQSAVDIMALVQNIKANGLGVKLDASRIYLVGQSLGSFIGSLVHAVEPGVKAAVINVGGDSVVDTARQAYGDDTDIGYLFVYNAALLAVAGDCARQPGLRLLLSLSRPGHADGHGWRQRDPAGVRGGRLAERPGRPPGLCASLQAEAAARCARQADALPVRMGRYRDGQSCGVESGACLRGPRTTVVRHAAGAVFPLRSGACDRSAPGLRVHAGCGVFNSAAPLPGQSVDCRTVERRRAGPDARSPAAGRTLLQVGHDRCVTAILPEPQSCDIADDSPLHLAHPGLPSASSRRPAVRSVGLRTAGIIPRSLGSALR